MSTTADKIKEIKAEVARTQVNKVSHPNCRHAR